MDSKCGDGKMRKLFMVVGMLAALANSAISATNCATTYSGSGDEEMADQNCTDSRGPYDTTFGAPFLQNRQQDCQVFCTGYGQQRTCFKNCN
jgi:hypothetical protein